MIVPNRNTLVAIKIAPTRIVNVASVRSGCELPAATPAANSVEPVNTATVEVVLTDSVREPPSSAYTTIGTMHV